MSAAADWRAWWPRRCFDARLVRPLERVGLPDQFIECGSVPFLQSKYGLTPEHIVEAARRALTRGK